MLIYVVDRGNPDWAVYTRPLIKAYAEKHGYDLIFADCGFRADRHPSWQKMRVFDFVDAPFVLLMDLDFCPLPWAPPIHEHLDFDKVNLAYNMRWNETEPDKHLRETREKRRGLPHGAMLYNMGLCGVPKKYAEDFKRLWERGEVVKLWWEQPEVNLWIQENKIPVQPINYRFNTITCQAIQPMPTWREKWFIHPAGHDHRTDFVKNLVSLL